MQYGGLFRSTRIPKKDRDELAKFEESEARHVVLQRGHAFYTLDVLNADGTAVPEGEVSIALLIHLACTLPFFDIVS